MSSGPLYLMFVERILNILGQLRPQNGCRLHPQLYARRGISNNHLV